MRVLSFQPPAARFSSNSSKNGMNHRLSTTPQSQLAAAPTPRFGNDNGNGNGGNDNNIFQTFTINSWDLEKQLGGPSSRHAHFYKPVAAEPPAPPPSPRNEDQLSGFYSYNMTPREIKAKLDQYIIGQEGPKKKIAVAVHNHIKRIGFQVSDIDVKAALAECTEWKGTPEEAKRFSIKLTRLIREATLQNESLPTIIAGVLKAAEGNGKMTVQYKPGAFEPSQAFVSIQPNLYMDAGQHIVKKVRRAQDLKEMDAISDRLKNVQIAKQNILIIGGTGTGKTEIARALANTLDFPFATENASQITSAGYIGGKADGVLKKLIDAAEGDLEAAGRGIAFLDEVDKLRTSSYDSGTSKDVNGKGAQDSLLRIIEDGDVDVEMGERNKQKLNTRNILFVCAGAFAGLEDIVARRLFKKKEIMGFGHKAGSKSADKMTQQEKRALLKYVTPDDLIEYGMTPEFVGRLPVIVTMDEMTSPMLKRILTEPKNALVKQYQLLAAQDGLELTFTDEAYEAIAEYAIARNTGARALQTIMDRLLEDALFDSPDLNGETLEYKVTGEMVKAAITKSFMPEQNQA